MCRVLVIEDDQETRDAIVRILQPDRHSIATAATISEAVCKLEETRPSVILLDLRLGEERGEDFLDKYTWHSAVIIVTGEALNEDEEAALIDKGAAAILYKPFSAKMLRSLTARLHKLAPVDSSMSLFIEKMDNMTKKLVEAKCRLASSI